MAPARSSVAAPAMQLQNGFGSIRTLTGKREKVKVLLVLYDGKQHAKDVSLTIYFCSNRACRSLRYTMMWVSRAFAN